MHRSTWGKVWRTVFALVLVLATATVGSAQSVVDARRVEFTPSTDHNAVDPTSGVALLQSYSLLIFVAGNTTPLRAVSLGKPSPQSGGMILVDFVSLLAPPLSAGVIYEAVVEAVGPGGITASARSNTFSVAGGACAASISPTSQSISAAGGPGSSTVTVGTGCVWSAVSNVSWITVTTGASSSGSGSVTFSVAANTSSTSRTGTLTIAGITFTVNQAGATCSPTISPTSVNAVAAGTSGSVAVTAAVGCSWTATSNATWITIAPGASGMGNGSVAYSVAANPNSTTRTGTVTVAGNTFTVTQAGATCAPTISPTSLNAAAAGTSGSVVVTAAAGCSWTATSNATWITIAPGASGMGNGSVAYSVAANPNSTTRTGTVTVAGNTFTVTQAGTSCAPTISPTSANVVAAGGTGSVPVTAATGCTWTATSNAPWITVTAGATGSGSGSVSYSVAANTGTASRTGTVTIAGATFTITQAGTSCAPTISPTSANVVAAGATGSVAVAASTGCSWTATSNDPWITITAGATGSGAGSVSYSVPANPNGTARTGTVSVAGNTFTINQAAATCAPTISPTSANVVAAGGTGSVPVTAATGCTWTATSNAPWITVTAGATGSGAGSVAYSVAANTSTFEPNRDGHDRGRDLYHHPGWNVLRAHDLTDVVQRRRGRRHGQRRRDCGHRLQLDGHEQRVVDHGYGGRHRQRQWLGHLQRCGKSRRHRAHGHDHRCGGDLHHHPGRGHVRAHDLTDVVQRRRGGHHRDRHRHRSHRLQLDGFE